MNIKVKTVLRWLIVTNILVILLPMIYMIQNTTIDTLLTLTIVLGTFKLLLTLCFLLFGVTERSKSERHNNNKWIR
jgi:hypothetical protein